jgi:hypothetical protein
MVAFVPFEDEEQATFVEWLDLQQLKYTAIPNSTYTTSQNQKNKNHRLGLRPGFSDMVVIIPIDKSKDGEGYVLCIEMKRREGGTQSKHQKSWELAINGLNVPNIQYYLCKGADRAVKTVIHYLKTVDNSVF